MGSVHVHLNSLQVNIPSTFSHVMGMADGVTILSIFSTNFTNTHFFLIYHKDTNIHEVLYFLVILSTVRTNYAAS
jgi:hypothetical protein